MRVYIDSRYLFETCAHPVPWAPGASAVKGCAPGRAAVRTTIETHRIFHTFERLKGPAKGKGPDRSRGEAPATRRNLWCRNSEKLCMPSPFPLKMRVNALGLYGNHVMAWRPPLRRPLSSWVQRRTCFCFSVCHPRKRICFCSCPCRG